MDAQTTTVLAAALVSGVGFPIAVSWFLLKRMDPHVVKLSADIRDLREAIRVLCERVDENHKHKTPPVW